VVINEDGQVDMNYSFPYYGKNNIDYLSKIIYKPSQKGFYYLEVSGLEKVIDCKLTCTPAPKSINK